MSSRGIFFVVLEGKREKKREKRKEKREGKEGKRKRRKRGKREEENKDEGRPPIAAPASTITTLLKRTMLPYNLLHHVFEYLDRLAGLNQDFCNAAAFVAELAPIGGYPALSTK